MARAINLSRQQALMVSGRVARSFLARGRGLLGSRRLEEGEGLAILSANWIHTLFMAWPIDVIYLGDDGRVVHLTEEMPPWRIGPWVRAARWVLELPAGTIQATGTRVGDRVSLEA